MSRGLSGGQRIILGLLDGSREGRVYTNPDKGCDTAELLDELIARRLVNSKAPRKQQMYTVVRACKSLQARGLVEGEYLVDIDHPHCRTLHWTVA